MSGSERENGVGHGHVRRAACVAGLVVASLGGCAHRDAIQTPVQWWHDLEGGRIAQDRPPPPGVNQPYPLIGTTPAKAPTLPTPQERIALTSSLTDQRNSTLRENTADPLPPPGTQVGTAPPPPPGAKGGSKTGATPATPPAPDPNRSSAVFEGATAEPAGTPAAPVAKAPAAPPARPSETRKPDANAATDAPLLGMPALQAPPPPEATDAPMPEFAPNAPAIPWIHGITVPHHVAAAAPDIPRLAETGTPVAFDFGTDTIQDGESGTVSAIAHRWRHGTLAVHGYGDATSAVPAAQVASLDLAWRRARAIAEMLVTAGVPASAVNISAAAFGHDVTITENP